MQKILIIDDDHQVRSAFGTLLRNNNCETYTAENGTEGIHVFERESPDLVLVDLKMPGLNGMEVLKALKQRTADLPVVIITAHGDVPTAVEAIKLGAFDFIIKPPDLNHLFVTIKRAMELSYLSRELKRLRAGVETSIEVLFGTSQHAKKLAHQINQLADTDLAVIIEGETGVGKTIAARALHTYSRRGNGPFISVDMGTIVESLAESELFGHEKGAFTGAEKVKSGYFERARGGTIFIDEIENMTPAIQAKLLRVVDEKVIHPVGSAAPVPVDVRIVAATNRNLQELVADGKFRDDLFFRLGEFMITIPPLRDRIEDVEYLAERFLEEAAADFRKETRIAADAMTKLMLHRWPGNVRELKNVVRRAVFLAEGNMIMPEHVQFIPDTSSAANRPSETAYSLNHQVRSLERMLIEQALKLTGGNKTKTASLLNIDFKTLAKKIRELGIQH